MNLIQYLYNRKVRKLAERIISHQIPLSDTEVSESVIRNSIRTAEKFYEIWDEIVKEN